MGEIPPSGMIFDIGVLVIGNTIGECVSVKLMKRDVVWDSVRIRVEIDISKPLRRIVKLTLDTKNPSVGILLRYECLPEFYYGCGLLGHQFKECS